MYKIKITGELNPELRNLGISSGDVVQAHFQNTNQAMYFQTVYYGNIQQCVVYPDNYEIVESPKELVPNPQRYFVMIQPGIVPAKKHFKKEIEAFVDEYNHCIISNPSKFKLILKNWCFSNAIKYDDFPERNTYFAVDCFMVQLVEVKSDKNL